MVAAVETMMYAKGGGRPWHGLGTAVEDAPTSEAAIKLAGLDWDVEKRPVYIVKDGEFVIVDGRYATVRRTDEKVLGFVAEEYQVMQNNQGFEILDRAIGDLGIEVRYETAGSLRGGEQVFVTARIPKDVKIGRGDVQFPYLMLRTGHDGGTALDIVPTLIRPVCWNTVTMAIGSRDQHGREYHGLTMWHVGDVEAKVAQAKAALNLSLRKMDEFAEAMNILSSVKVTKSMAEEFIGAVVPEIYLLPEGQRPVQVLLPAPDSARYIQFVTAAQYERAKKFREQRVDILEECYKQEVAVGGTSAYSLFNAATGYADHARPRMWKASENRLNTVMFGTGATIKRRAYEAIGKVAKTDLPSI